MGTNYYAIKKKPSLHNEPLHIGKASAGWKFVFHGYMSDDISIKSITDWVHYIRDNDMVILNEYDDTVPLDDFLELVEKLQSNENKDNFTRDANIDGYRFQFSEFC